MERSNPMAGADGLVRGFGSQPRVGLVHRDVSVQSRVAPADPPDQRLHGVDRRKRTRAERAGQFGDRCPHGIDRSHLPSLLRQRAALVRSFLGVRDWEEPMRSCTSRVVIVFVAIVLGFGAAASAADAPAGTMTWGVHITLASRWLDPGETEGIATPFMVLYALHDALVKPMPAGLYTPSLAESTADACLVRMREASYCVNAISVALCVP